MVTFENQKRSNFVLKDLSTINLTSISEVFSIYTIYKKQLIDLTKGVM